MSAEIERIEPRVFEPVARADTDSWVSVVQDVIRFAEIVNDTDFVPKGLRGSMPATAAAMLYGREVGLPPMTALSSTHVVDGRPAISAEAMRALVFAAGHEIVVDETTGAECTLRGRRRGSDRWSPPISWTLSQARAAGLLGRQNWQRYPRAMLVARATAELCRLVFPDVIHGFAVVEELDEATGASLPAADAPETRSHTPKPVRRRTPRVASSRVDSRPAAVPPESPRPVEASDLPPLPGEPGYVEDETPEAVPPDEAAGSSPGPSTASGEGSSAGHDATSPDAAPVVELAPEIVKPDTAPPVAPRMVSRAQERMLFSLFGDLDLNDRDSRLDVSATIVGRPLSSSNDLTNDEATGLIDTLARCRTNVDVMALVDHIRQAEQPPLPFGDPEPAP